MTRRAHGILAMMVALASAGVAFAQEAPPEEAPEQTPEETPEQAPEDEAPPEPPADEDTEAEGDETVEPSEPPVEPEEAVDPETPVGDEAIDDEEMEPPPEEDGDPFEDASDLVTGDVVVAARAEEVFNAGGSLHSMGERELAELSYNDPMAVLTRVPGVYVRSEDGFGLRPNIGLRGGSSERSRRVTLMEDGILLAPAPYSAPAAYYFPMMARMTGVEVAAGPAAILYGPNTIGGAIDLESRAIPTRRRGYVDLALGNTWYGRAHAHFGDSNEWGGFLLEAIHLRSSGFHELDAAPGVDTDTGFHRTDILGRAELHGDLDESYYHRLELTVGLGLEQSNETYLGTTDADFAASPYLRYASTQLDQMDWWRTRVHLRYEIESDDVQVRVTAYRHDFERTWYRLDHFCDTLNDAPEGEQDTCNAAVGFERILRSPDVYASQLGRLTGTIEPMPGDAPLIALRNHRVFAAQGVQADSSLSAVTGDFSHRIRVGARVHFDEVTRAHTGDTYQLERQQMVLQSSGLELERNHDSAWAVSGYASWGITWRGLTLSPGVRTELIWTENEERFSGQRVYGEQLALLPGLGAQYVIVPGVAVFAGAHLGYSPVAPGSSADVLPEVAWNYELGARYGRITDPTHAQLTYFVSDYDNLASLCSLATGCTADMIDRQFNAGSALVMGIEAEASHTFELDELSVPISGSYTWTWTRLETAFESPNPQLGAVEVGDQLPYVPEHQLSLRAGVRFRFLQVFVNGAFTSRMRDVAGRGDGAPEDWTDDVFMLDARASVEVLDGVRVYVRGENLTDARPVLTRRPWGARGPKPVLVQGGIEIDFR